MPYKNKMDMHIHTDNSPDGEHTAMLMCEYAMNQGLRAIAITDHCEVDLYHKDHFDRSLRQSRFEAMKGRSVYTGCMIVLAGVELGQPTHDIAQANEIVSRCPLDIVLASVHNLEGEQDFYYLDYRERDPYPLMERYFGEVLDTVEWGGFDVLAHLTYPTRYICGRDGVPLDLTRFDDALEHILRRLAEQGKALEINTSGLRKGAEETIPSARYVKRFRELGGEFITIGSDAHACGDVGANVEDGMRIAFDAGFRHIALYNKHQPFLIDIG